MQRRLVSLWYLNIALINIYFLEATQNIKSGNVMSFKMRNLQRLHSKNLNLNFRTFETLTLLLCKYKY